VAAEREPAGCFIVRADEKLIAFSFLLSAISGKNDERKNETKKILT